MSKNATTSTLDHSGSGKQGFLARIATSKWQWRLALLVLIAQGAITVTGSIVRVTGSGLGCVTWPQCQPGSLIPVAGAAPWLHQAIEWGNRLLTFVVGAAALLLVLSVFKAGRSSRVRGWAVFQLAGVVVQAIIGGISVLVKLKWWAVALHFLPSMVLVFFAAILLERISEPDDGVPTQLYPRVLQHLAAGSAAVLFVVLATGTMVTGAGVHSGDADVDDRLQIDLAEIAHIHAHFMYLYLGLTIGLIVALLACSSRPRALKLGVWLIVFTLVQAAIGIIQYNWGVPRWTVPVHVGFSSVVTAFTGLVYAQSRRRLRADESAASIA